MLRQPFQDSFDIHDNVRWKNGGNTGGIMLISSRNIFCFPIFSCTVAAIILVRIRRHEYPNSTSKVCCYPVIDNRHTDIACDKIQFKTHFYRSPIYAASPVPSA
jgi:hypothetical protein